MKKRILSILLALCMVLMLCPVTAFAEDNYSTLTWNFQYGTLIDNGVEQKTSPYVYRGYRGNAISLVHVENCSPYEFVGWKEAGSGTVYKPDVLFMMDDSEYTFDAVYQVQGSLAVTVDGFEVGNTPADCTYSFESTIPGVEFSKDDIQYIEWHKYAADGDLYPMNNTDVFRVDTRYRCVIQLDNNGLTEVPAVTVNGKTPEDCLIATENGVPVQLQIEVTLGTPALTLTIDGPDVVCAQQDYEFTVTPPAGVTLDPQFRYNTDTSGRSADLEIDDDGVGHGTVSVEWYDLQTNCFTLTAHGTGPNGDTVRGTKTVRVSPEHLYVDGVCGCGVKQQYTVEYIGGGDDPICMNFKTHGEDLTLRGETFTMDGFVQTGWVDGQGAVYKLGAAYTEDRDVTLYPVFDKIVTVTAPFTITVDVRGSRERGETVFELELVDERGEKLSFADDVTVSGTMTTTNGKGDYDGALTFTGPSQQLRNMLGEGAFVRQVNGGKANWTYDDTVWGLWLFDGAAYATADSAGFIVLILPTTKNDAGDYYIDWDSLDLEKDVLKQMTFTNTYTKYTTRPSGNGSNTGTITSPQTGDNSNLAVWFALLAVSAAGVIGAGVYSKRRRSSR